jgi:uncharacterized protein YjbI with pentapeptide repeats
MRAGVCIAWTRLILLFLGWTLAAGHTQLVAQNRPDKELATYAKLNRISFSRFRSLVLDGKEVIGWRVPASHILRVLEDSPLNQSSRARLQLKGCRIVDEAVRLLGPLRRVEQYPKDLSDHLKGRGLTQAVYITLPIQIVDSVFEKDFDLTGVVLESEVTLEDVGFNGSAYFQGAAFLKRAIFKRVHFGEISDFSGVFFLASMTFNNCEFKRQANFSTANVRRDARIYFTGEKLDVPLDFSGSINLGSLTFEGKERTLQIGDKVYMNGINGDPSAPAGELHMKNVELSNSLYLDQSRWATLDFAEAENGSHRPIRFGGFCDFRNGIFGTANFAGAEFEKGGDFSGAEFTTLLSFERTKLREPIRLDWKQIREKLGRVNEKGQTEKLSKESYVELETNFKRLEDLYGENESRYERRTIWEGKRFWWAVSGYSVRPGRTVGWIGAFLLMFSVINWFAFRGSWFPPASKRDRLLDRMANAVRLALRAAAPKPKVPERFSPNKRGKALFYFEYGWFKFLEVVAVITFSNTSPLLKEIIPYFFPG